MIQINLIPEVKLEYLKVERQHRRVVAGSMVTSIVAVAIVAVLGIFLGGQLVYENILMKNIDKDFAKFKQDNPDGGDLLTLQNQLSTISNLTKQKSKMSNSVKLMSSVSYASGSDVQITGVNVMPGDSIISIEGKSPRGFAGADAFRKTLLSTKICFIDLDDEAKKDDSLSFEQICSDAKSKADKYNPPKGVEVSLVDLSDNVVVSDSNYVDDPSRDKIIRFTLEFTYPSEAMTNDHAQVVLMTPDKQINVTDSKLGVPESLFNESSVKNEGDKNEN